ncbi:MAG: hypothetical protein HDR79_07435 [Bacteroides sp.]|nr:hypothetical protein [Bacteroides sp.]
MKKFISFCAAMLLGLGSMLAQENYKAVKGYVVDKNGNPIPGAEVKDSKGESTITDHDGSFMLNVPLKTKKIVASYDGMATQSRRIKPDQNTIFTLRQERNNPAFLTGIIGYSYSSHLHRGNGKFIPFVSIMGGRLGNWGFYGKLAGSPYEGSVSATVGALKNVYERKFFVFFGAGYGRCYTETSNSDIYGNADYADLNGFALDLGVLIKPRRHFNITIGYNLIYGFSDKTEELSMDSGDNMINGLQIGFGYVF